MYRWKFSTAKTFDQTWIFVWEQNFADYNFEHAHQLIKIKIPRDIYFKPLGTGSGV